MHDICMLKHLTALAFRSRAQHAVLPRVRLLHLLQGFPLGLGDGEEAGGIQASLDDCSHVRQDEGAPLLGMVVEIPGNVGYTLLLWFLHTCTSRLSVLYSCDEGGPQLYVALLMVHCL